MLAVSHLLALQLAGAFLLGGLLGSAVFAILYRVVLDHSDAFDRDLDLTRSSDPRP